MRKLCILLLLIGLTGCGATVSRQAAQSASDNIIVYFNDPLAGLPEMTHLSAQANGLDQVLIDLIDSAGSSLDIAMYHLTLRALLDALERACTRRVTIRLVLEAGQSRPQRLASCVQLKLDTNDRLMHHKFMVVDQRTVWTGSTNWTEAGFYFDANNSVVIQSEAVAQAYEAEFEEMYSRGRYGPSKRDTNDERFTVDGISLELYFSPSDQPRQRLLELIRRSEKSIQIAIYAFTDSALYEELLAAYRRGVRVEAVWDFLSQADCQFSKADDLRKAGIGISEAGPGLLHDKFAVIDDRIVITGSANWSQSGMENNDENILVMQSERIAQQYRESFEQLVEDVRRYERDTHQPPRLEMRHFEVARDGALIQWHPHALGVIDRYEICRLSDPTASACEQKYEAPGWAWYFLDREVTAGREYAYQVRSQTAGQWTDYSNVYRTWVPDNIPLLSPQQAVQDLQVYEGKLVTVRFQVVNKPGPTGRQGHIYLNAGEDYKTDFTAFIPACALERFTGSGLDLFGLEDQMVEVTGELEEYNGPEIVVTGPWQIRVLP